MFNFNKPRNPGTELYKILGVSQTATEAEIISAYKKLAKVLHPDKPTGDAEKFKKINYAKEMLCDPEKRRIYDESGEEGLNDSSNGRPDMPGMPDDIFDLFMPGMRRRQTPRGPSKSKHMGVKLEVSLEDLYTGKTVPFEFDRFIKCSQCKATGANSPEDIVTCEACGGKGQQVRIAQMGHMTTQQIMQCDTCYGKGKSIKKGKECSKCKGERMCEEKYKTDVSIRAGMSNGDKISLKGKAHEHPDCDETGDLYVVIEEIPNSSGIMRNGNDLIYEKQIDLVDALCGVKFYIKQLDGRYLNVSYDDVITSNQLLKIEGEGMPILDNMSNGDMLVKFNVSFPLVLDSKRKKLLRKILPKTSDILGGIEPDSNSDVEEKVLESINDTTYDNEDNEAHHFGDFHGGEESQGVECAQQ